LGGQLAAGQHVALVDPDLDSDDAVGGVSFGGTVINVGPQRVQGHAAFAVPFGTGDFNAVQATGALDPDPLCTQTHGVLHGAFHGATEHDALFELLRDGIGNQLGIGF